MSKDLLLEIGTEEIPAGLMTDILSNLEEVAADVFTDYRLNVGTVKVTGTPRRLVLYVEEAAEEQEDLHKEIRGPAKSIAFDEDGNPTQAGEGFARGQGLTPEELEIRDTEDGEYVFACTTEEGVDTEELLPDILPEIITRLDFSQSMRWADKDLEFIRPIQWLLSLYGSQVIHFSLAGIEASNCSRGHRFLSEGKIEIANPEEYFAVLEDEFVVADHHQRREMIVDQIEAIEAEKEVEVIVEDELLTEVNFLIEYPTALAGRFEAEFLELPEEVLITSMREHQWYFPVEDGSGNLENMFVTVRNGNQEHLDTVRAGNEKVLRARLADAKFFYEEDQQESLESKVDRLKDIIFQEDLGTIYEKVERLMAGAEKLARQLELSETKINQACRAAKLAKADLVTEMVNEFPKLQGIMGREYALLDGEPEAVAIAIFEHYLPRQADDDLPVSKLGQVVSITEKIDNIVGCFGVGLIPTGSEDPYALRRQAQGVVKILLTAELDLTLDQIVDNALELLADKLQRSREEVRSDVLAFFSGRLETLLEAEGIRYDVIDAVLAIDSFAVPDILSRAEAVMKFRQDDDFEALITGFKRASNLAEKAAASEEEIDAQLFTSEAEEELYSTYQEVKSKVDNLVAQEDYLVALQEVTKLKAPIDQLFNSVRVMAEDEEVKENRLNLLARVSDLLSQIADLTKIVID